MVVMKKFFQKAGYLVVKTGQYLCIFHCVTNYCVSAVKCYGDSMEPAIHTGDIWLVECVSRIKRTIQKGDIVEIQSPFNPDLMLCKRIIAMEGDKVTKTNSDSVYIPRGHIWIEGDNKSVSLDSREYGPVPYGLIKSRLMFRIWSSYR